MDSILIHIVTQEVCGEHNSQSDIYNSSSNSSMSEQQGFIDGTPVTGYAGSDMGVRLLMLHTEAAVAS
jgi:hypothetical protein